MRHIKAGTPIGILNPGKGKEKFYLERYLPAEILEPFVEHYWIVKWDLREDEPYLSETLPHPSIHLVFEKDNTRIVGVMEGKFSRLLEDKGKVLGVKFKPGGFYPFIKKPVSEFTNKFVAPEKFFEDDIKALEEDILSSDNDENMIKHAESFIVESLPGYDENLEVINNIVELIISDKEIKKVEQIVKKVKINKRTLQRIFNHYIGISPKWMIKRYRLHDAAEQLANENDVDLIKIALDLGYFDQAHFIKDFKTVVGKTPSEYLRFIQKN